MFDEANIAAAISACASEGWTDAARNDAVADEFSTALEEICAAYNFGRCDDSEATDALVSLASLALSRDASAVASAVDHYDMSDATKKLLDVIGVEIFTPLMECADAVDDRIAEACACAMVDACAEACGPRDMFVMALGALQSRVERAVKDLDGDDDDDRDYAGHHEPSVRHRGWRLTGAICAGLATWLRRAKNPASLAPDAIPIVASLAELCGRCARFVAEAEGQAGGGYDPARHHGPEAAYRGVGEFFKVACDAMHGERAGGHALADGMRALALDPRRLFRPTTTTATTPATTSPPFVTGDGGSPAPSAQGSRRGCVEPRTPRRSPPTRSQSSRPSRSYAADARASSPRPKGRLGGDTNRRGTTAPRRRTAASANFSKSRATRGTANARGGTRSRTGCARWRWTRGGCSDPRLAGDCARTRTTSGCCKGSGPSTTFCRLRISRQTTRRATRRPTG